MHNFIKPLIKFLAVAQYVVIGIGVLAGFAVVIAAFNSGSNTQISNLFVFIPFLSIFFLAVWGFFWLAKFMLEGCEDKLAYQSALTQILAIIGILLLSLIGAIFAGALLLIVLLYNAYRRLPK